MLRKSLIRLRILHKRLLLHGFRCSDARRNAPLGQDTERRDAARLVERVETERMDRGAHERLHARMEHILREVASSPAH